jgi:hypothetical protein
MMIRVTNGGRAPAVLLLLLVAGCGGGAASTGQASTAGPGSSATAAGSAGPTGSATAAGSTGGTTTTACAIASTAEVSAFAGQNLTRLAQPKVAHLAHSSNCVYQNASGGGLAILVDSRGDGSGLVQAAEQQGGKAVSGIGDSAALSRLGSVVAVNAVKGGVLVSVSVDKITESDGAIEAFVRALIGRV